MAHPHLSHVMAEFEARIHRTKNRLIAIPARIQREVGLERRPNNHLLLVSLRPKGKGRWNRHYVKLTCDNEFCVPADVTHLRGGAAVEVKIHRVIADAPPEPTTPGARGAGLILELATRDRPGWREDGSERVDEYLRRETGSG